MITIEQMVQREVLCCMSSLVSTLAEGYRPENNHVGAKGRDLTLLAEQASELAAPVLDYEEAAIQAGWIEDKKGSWFHAPKGALRCKAARYSGVRALCDVENIDPYEWEVYEHWAVSQWLAEKLIAQGERVDTDFANFNIWARTTTGQGITMDGCIQRIYADMMAPHTLDSVAPGA